MIYKNKKNEKVYRIIGRVINATNAQDGQVMFLYEQTENRGKLFVREEKEFFEKFEKI